MILNTLSCIFIFIVSLLLALPLGAYMSKVYSSDKNLFDFLKPFERFIFKVCRINPMQEMNWKQYLIAMAMINSVWLIYGFIMLMVQGKQIGRASCRERV